MAELGIRLEAGVDAACDDPRVIEWVKLHGIDPRNVYAIEVYQESFDAWCFHVVPGYGKHLHARCPSKGDVPEQPMGHACKAAKVHRDFIAPFPPGVMAGPGHPARNAHLN